VSDGSWRRLPGRASFYIQEARKRRGSFFATRVAHDPGSPDRTGGGYYPLMIGSFKQALYSGMQ
jgi:hypothetical protein